MRYRVRKFVVLFCGLLTALTFAQKAPAPPIIDSRISRGYRSITQAEMRADLTFLSSEALDGRMSLARGSEVAIQFIAAEFAKAGIQPIVPSSIGPTYFQDVPIIEYVTDARETALVLERGGVKRAFAYAADFNGGFPRDSTVRAPVVFAGYGITAPEYRYDDYAGLDASGKIVLVLDHEPQENDPASIFNGLGNTRHANVHSKIVNAQKHGAVAVLVMNEPNRTHPTNAERSARIPSPLPRGSRIPSQALADSEITIPQVTVSDAVSNLLLSASGKTPREIQAAIDATVGATTKPPGVTLPDTVVELRMVNASARRGHSANVLGFVEGIDPELKAETIVISAHFDHNGALGGVIFPGADDNGSGTIGVVEMARAFGNPFGNVAKPKRSVLLAVFAAEERGLLGSYYYVAHPIRPLATTRAVINFDMIGRDEKPSAQTDGLMEIDPDTSNELNFTGTVYSPDYRAAVERANLKIGLKLNYKWEEDAALNLFARSDQFPFLLKGIPAVWWFTGFHPDYHQPTDTVEKIDFAKMEKIVRLAYLAAFEFGDEPTPPRFKADPKGR